MSTSIFPLNRCLFVYFPSLQRTLFVMESLLRSDLPDILSHFDLVLQDLTDLMSSSNSSIKAKANKVIFATAFGLYIIHVIIELATTALCYGEGCGLDVVVPHNYIHELCSSLLPEVLLVGTCVEKSTFT